MNHVLLQLLLQPRHTYSTILDPYRRGAYSSRHIKVVLAEIREVCLLHGGMDGDQQAPYGRGGLLERPAPMAKFCVGRHGSGPREWLDIEVNLSEDGEISIWFLRKRLQKEMGESTHLFNPPSRGQVLICRLIESPALLRRQGTMEWPDMDQVKLMLPEPDLGDVVDVQ